MRHALPIPRQKATRTVAWMLLTALSLAQADDPKPLPEVLVTGEETFGEAASATEGSIGSAQLARRPLSRPGDVLEAVPGLIISQHSGNGKANQYYLRGFNLDHGTDFATYLGGMPMNMPTHGHGQGYSDLQFLMPELIERIHFHKGPYTAEQGDFSSAGIAYIDYFRKLEAPSVSVTVGGGGYRRALVSGSSTEGSRTWLHAFEWNTNNGPWDTPERLGKLNAVLRVSEGTRSNGWSVTGMAYRSQWDATDQVPQRAMDRGLIGRFGSLDTSDGGATRRMSLSGEWSAQDPTQWTRANAYVIDSRLNLWSNFTFCLNDIARNGNCNRGDQFEQTDRRTVGGFDVARSWSGTVAQRPIEFTLGAQGRLDRIGNVGLYLTSARARYETVREDRVNQGSGGLYGEARIELADRVRAVLGARADFYRFDVASDRAANSDRVSARVASPKASLVFGPWHKTELYLNGGYGFHSNDARGVTMRVNPDPRDTGFLGAMPRVTPLAKARGVEAGVRSQPLPGWNTTFALWALHADAELVFRGDAGTTQASYPSRRSGVEWTSQWQVAKRMSIDTAIALSRARYAQIDPAVVSGNYIPGAIEKTLAAGFTADVTERIDTSLRVRHFGARPLNEDNSVRSRPSTLVNLRVGYKASRQTTLTLDVLNLFNRPASDVDYFYQSRLRGEAAASGDIHTHPAEPRALRLSLRLAY